MVVLVCPNTYNEQVQITQPVTLEGISSGDLDQVVISASGGLTQTATDDFGDTIAYQIWVNNVSGPVNIRNITVDGVGNGVSGCGSYPYTYVVGIFYQNTPGIVNQITARNQTNPGFCGIGVYLEGGAANPSVALENSSIHDFDGIGIYAENNSTPSELTATIKGNNVLATPPTGEAIGLFGGVTGTVAGNFVAGSYEGINACCGSNGSISGNTITNTSVGVAAEADGLSVTSNKIFNVVTEGIFVGSSVPKIKSNTIVNAPVGIEFFCYADNNVLSNTIIDASTGVDSVPSSVVTTNKYSNVTTVRTGC
jgi:hypothetical protein